MFSSHDRLKKRTPANGIDRREYIRLLVDEYYETTNIEAQQQVTANLANFAYDPINYQYLRDASAVELFIQLLTSPNPHLTLHGTAGLCNIILDTESRQKIIELNGPQSFITLLDHSEEGIVINALCALIQLDSIDSWNQIHTPETSAKLRHLRSSSNVVIGNLATVLSEQGVL